MWTLIGLVGILAVVFWVTVPWPEKWIGIAILGLGGSLLGIGRWIERHWEDPGAGGKGSR